MAKIERIIEWQEEKQRTPEEVLKFLMDQLKVDGMERIIVAVFNKGKQYYVPGSEDRDYNHAMILWDLEQFKHHWLNDALDDEDE